MAQNELALLYENGKSIKKDLREAVYWYNKAAENENEFAQCNLGRCYQLGIGVKKDETKAFEYYKESAKKEYNISHDNAALLLKNNLECENNESISNSYAIAMDLYNKVVKNVETLA